jgi:hypothetical protein
MLLPRIGGLIVLGGFGYGVAIYGRMAYVTAVEGFNSWAWMLVFLAPMTLLAVPAAIIVLKNRNHRLGRRLTTPVLVVTVLTGLLAIGNSPPVGSFIDDYKAAQLSRDLQVPPYESSQGLSTLDYADKLAAEFKLQGSLIAIGSAAAFFVLVRRGAIFVRRPKPAPAAAAAPES